MNKLVMVYSYNGIIFSNKKVNYYDNMDDSHRYNDGQKKPETKNDYYLILFI